MPNSSLFATLDNPTFWGSLTNPDPYCKKHAYKGRLLRAISPIAETVNKTRESLYYDTVRGLFDFVKDAFDDIVKLRPHRFCETADFNLKRMSGPLKCILSAPFTISLSTVHGVIYNDEPCSSYQDYLLGEVQTDINPLKRVPLLGRALYIPSELARAVANEVVKVIDIALLILGASSDTVKLLYSPVNALIGKAIPSLKFDLRSYCSTSEILEEVDAFSDNSHAFSDEVDSSDEEEEDLEDAFNPYAFSNDATPPITRERAKPSLGTVKNQLNSAVDLAVNLPISAAFSLPKGLLSGINATVTGKILI